MAEQNAGVVKGLYEAFGRGDVPAVLGGMTEDIEWNEAEGMPQGGTYRGPGAVAENVFGETLDLPAVHVWYLRDGKVARFRQFMDTVKYREVVP